MLRKRKSTEPVDQVVAELPAGHRDAESEWFVPAELRSDYLAAEVSVQEVARAERWLERELIIAENTARQEPVVAAAIERADEAGNPERANALRRLFYGGEVRATRIGNTGFGERQPTHAFLPQDYESLGLRMTRERLLTAGERELAAHRARLGVAAKIRDQRERHEEAVLRMTCPQCNIRGDQDVRTRTIRVTGMSPVTVRCCGACESAITWEMRRRAARQPLPGGKTRAQIAANVLDTLS